MNRNIIRLSWILWSSLRFLIIKLFKFSNIKVTKINIVSPSTEITIGKNSFLQIGKLFKSGRNSRLFLKNNAEMIIGDYCSLNSGCLLICHKKITIGNNVQFGPNVFVYDHDHDYKQKEGLEKLKYLTTPVVIGNNVWIGANTVILRGTVIGDNCVVGAGSVLKGRYKANSTIIQKREELVINYSN